MQGDHRSFHQTFLLVRTYHPNQSPVYLIHNDVFISTPSDQFERAPAVTETPTSESAVLTAEPTPVEPTEPVVPSAAVPEPVPTPTPVPAAAESSPVEAEPTAPAAPSTVASPTDSRPPIRDRNRSDKRRRGQLSAEKDPVVVPRPGRARAQDGRPRDVRDPRPPRPAPPRPKEDMRRTEPPKRRPSDRERGQLRVSRDRSGKHPEEAPK